MNRSAKSTRPQIRPSNGKPTIIRLKEITALESRKRMTRPFLVASDSSRKNPKGLTSMFKGGRTARPLVLSA